MYVLVSMYRQYTDNVAEMRLGNVYGPYESKQAAESAKTDLDFPTPEWVYVKRVN